MKPKYPKPPARSVSLGAGLRAIAQLHVPAGAQAAPVVKIKKARKPKKPKER